jgi:hypothetical protein
MKKTAILGFMALLAGCQNTPAEQQVVTQAEPQTITGVPCSYSCMPNNPCVQAPEPMVLKPRVVEVVGKPNRRPCCDNVISPFGNLQTYVPDAPEIYVISANRTVNSMLKEAAAFYEQIGTMKVYVDGAELKANDLPGGTEQGTKTLKKRFSNISNVIVVEDKDKAEYIVDSRVNWYDTATKTVPAIKYDMFLRSKEGRLIGEWSEIIHQAEGDRSWW